MKRLSRWRRARHQRPHVLPARRLRPRGPRAGQGASRPRLGRDRRLGLAAGPGATRATSTPASTCDPSTSRRGDAPMHPSYEDRPGAPDPVFAAVDDGAYEAHVAAWCRALEGADAAGADLLHLHHLTPLHEAAARVAPDVPVLGHLHGTELLMLEEIVDGAHPDWPHADAWLRRMRGWAARCERAAACSRPTRSGRAADLLRLDPGRFVVAPNGFDPERFAPHPRRPRRPLAPPPRRRAARLATGRRGGVGRLRRGRGSCARARARAAGRRPLHRGQARAAARPRVRARPGARSPSRPRSSCSAASRVSGRASTRST